MKDALVRICAWFTMILFFLVSLTGLAMLFAKDFEMITLIVLPLCMITSLTGWHARKFGLPAFKTNFLTKSVAIISLIFGGLAISLMPMLLAITKSFHGSWPAIRNSLIMFFPVVISALAILFSRSKSALQGNNQEPLGEPRANDAL
jgi:cytochrome b subunit of formate dehydrogenase